MREEIDALNWRIYAKLNNGVYEAEFTTTQNAYQEAIVPLFQSLDWLEAMLSAQTYPTGEETTVADWRLFTTLMRFDAVYVGYFKCNLRRIADYSALSNYVDSLLDVPVCKTVNMHHIKHHYYQSHQTINPSGVVPLGPL